MEEQLFLEGLAGACDYLSSRPIGDRAEKISLYFCDCQRVLGTGTKIAVSLSDIDAETCQDPNRTTCPKSFV
jgi:hypothetical protein